MRRREGAVVELWRDGGEAAWAGHQAALQQGQSLHSRFLLVVTKVGRVLLVSRQALRHCTVNLYLVTINYKNPSWTNITFPHIYVFDFKE
jgi:hypothetical protein